MYKALEQAPELWAVLFPSKVEEFILFVDPFRWPITSEETRSAFQLLLPGAGIDYKLFFFIDGLDEYGEDRDQLRYDQMVSLASHQNMCL